MPQLSNSKLRLAIVTTYPPSRGTLNEYAYHFVRALQKKEEVGEIILLTDELPVDVDINEKNPDGALTIRPTWRFGAVNNAWRILQAVRDTQPDAVIFNIQFTSFGDGKVSAALGLTAPALVRSAGFPTIALLHNIMETVDLESAGFAQNRLFSTLIRTAGNIVTRFLLKADYIALTIPKYVEIISEKYDADNVLLAPHGAFEATEIPDMTLPEGPRQIMTFGKFGTYKKIEVLVDAVQSLRSNSHPDVELIIAGSNSPNTPGYLEGVEEAYGQLPWVTYTGYVPEEDVPQLFQDSAVVVFPYTSTTGSSGVLHQAGGYGKATILPLIGDLAELITEEGFAGEFFIPDDANSLAQAIAAVLDDDEKRCQMGRQNYMASCSLTIDDVADWYLLHIETLLT